MSSPTTPRTKQWPEIEQKKISSFFLAEVFALIAIAQVFSQQPSKNFLKLFTEIFFDFVLKILAPFLLF